MTSLKCCIFMSEKHLSSSHLYRLMSHWWCEMKCPFLWETWHKLLSSDTSAMCKLELGRAEWFILPMGLRSSSGQTVFQSAVNSFPLMSLISRYRTDSYPSLTSRLHWWTLINSSIELSFNLPFYAAIYYSHKTKCFVLSFSNCAEGF